MKRKSNEQLRLEYLAKRAENMTDERYLRVSKATKRDSNVVLGSRIAISIVLLELQMYYGMDKEWLQEFYAKYNEFLNAYTDDDRDEINELIDGLKDSIGFHVLTGEMK